MDSEAEGERLPLQHWKAHLTFGQGRAAPSAPTSLGTNQVSSAPPPPPDPGSSTRTCDQHRASGVGRTLESFNTSKEDLPFQPPFSSLPPTGSPSRHHAPPSLNFIFLGQAVVKGGEVSRLLCTLRSCYQNSSSRISSIPPYTHTHPPRCPLADTKYGRGTFQTTRNFYCLELGGHQTRHLLGSPLRFSGLHTTLSTCRFSWGREGVGRGTKVWCESPVGDWGCLPSRDFTPPPPPSPPPGSCYQPGAALGQCPPQPIRLSWQRGWGTKLLLSSTLNLGAEDCLWSVPNSGPQAKTIIFLTASRTPPLRKAWTFLILSPKFRTDNNA
ncbi:uncharacterized protein [Dipodomys merriami]|uniref:uncharacterized protein n=1 Tax=Dipodomys merriami TaxID=94247 RepID=UPI00384E504A